MHVHDPKWEKSNTKIKKNNRLNSISGSLIKGNNIYNIKKKSILKKKEKDHFSFIGLHRVVKTKITKYIICNK